MSKVDRKHSWTKELKKIAPNSERTFKGLTARETMTLRTTVGRINSYKLNGNVTYQVAAQENRDGIYNIKVVCYDGILERRYGRIVVPTR